MFKRFSLSLFFFFFRVSMLIYIYVFVWFLNFFSFSSIRLARIRFRLDSTYNFSLQSRENAFTWAVWVQFMRLKWKRGERERGKFLFHPTKEIRNAYKGKLLPALSPPLPTLFSKSSFRKLGVIVSLKRNVRNIYSVAISFLFSFLFFCSK